jgi:DNA-directed RNA polymerase subunit RPC12/RpoP
MTEVKSFNCPNCNSPLSPQGSAKEIKCGYCGSSVIVPEDFRDNDAPLLFDQSPEHQQKAREVAIMRIRALTNKPPTEEQIQNFVEIFAMVEMERLNEIEVILAALKHTPVKGKEYDDLQKKISDILERE